jgi:HK97 family phage major capsid protein
MAAIDINRGTTNVALPQEVSSEIWAKTLNQSAFMTLAQNATLPGSGVTIQTITGEPEAQWVDETAAKPVATHTFGKKVVKPHKLAVIEPFSMEFRRDANALYAECVNRLPYALGKKFDQTILGTSAPGDGFDVLGGCTKVSLKSDQYKALVTAEDAIATADGIMDGIALAPKGKTMLLGVTDSTGHPLFNELSSDGISRILGANVSVNKGVYVSGKPAIVGIAGDFSDARFYSVEGIQMSVSEEATLATTGGTINLWQQNMFAVRFEVEVSFVVKDAAEYVLLTDGATA